MDGEMKVKLASEGTAHSRYSVLIRCSYRK